MFEKGVEIFTKVSPYTLPQHVVQPVHVVLVDQAVAEDAQNLVHPQPEERLAVLNGVLIDQTAAVNHPSEIPQAEHVMRLGWGGQQNAKRCSVNFKSARHYGTD